MPGLENTHLKVFWKKSLKVCLGGGSVSCSTTSNFGFAVSLDKLMSQKVSLCKLHFLPSNWLPSTYPVATPKPALWGHQASMKECFAIANRVLLFAKLIFRQWKGAATGQPDPMPAWQRVQAGPGREAVVCQSKHWRETPTSQLPWVQPAHPIWRHPLCKALEGSQLILLMHATRANSTAGFAKTCEHTFYLPKTNAGQNKGLPIHLLLSGFPYLTAIPSSVLTALCTWGSDQLPHCLTSEACSYLCFCICCLWYQLPHSLIPSIFLGVETSLLSFPLSLLCSSQFFTPVSTWELLSSALTCSQSPLPVVLLVLAALPCSVTHIPPTSLQFSHQAMPSVLMVSIGNLMAFSPSHPSAF